MCSKAEVLGREGGRLFSLLSSQSPKFMSPSLRPLKKVKKELFRNYPFCFSFSLCKDF